MKLLSEVEPLVNLMLYVQNRGIDGFAKMYSVCLAEHYDWKDSYIQEKWEACQRNFLGWFRNLDDERKVKFMNFAHNFYND